MLFKVINVDALEKLVTSACCDMPTVCVYMQPFLR